MISLTDQFAQRRYCHAAILPRVQGCFGFISGFRLASPIFAAGQGWVVGEALA